MIQAVNVNGSRGMIAPTTLRFDTAEEAIVVARRYCSPARCGYRYVVAIRVVRVDSQGYVDEVICEMDARVS